MKPSGSLAAQRENALQRRLAVAELRKSGQYRQTQIAEKLGVSRMTIKRDFAEIDTWWQAVAAQDIAAAKGQDLQRVEDLIIAIWDKARTGDVFCLDRVLKLLDRRARYLGLDAPEKIDLVGVMAEEAQRLAAELGLDAKSVLSEAQSILKEVRA